MDESSKVVTFNKPLEIEDLEISMNQGQFEKTIALQRQEIGKMKYLKNIGSHVKFKDM